MLPAAIRVRGPGSEAGGPDAQIRGHRIEPLVHPPRPCRLCGSGIAHFAHVHSRDYQRCPVCALTTVHPDQLPDRARERAEYELHENDPGDAGYRRFLSRLADPLVARLAPGARGLDYGCGPGPTLSVMLQERGFPTALWDPLFQADQAVLGGSYDFVTCTETIEHFHQPRHDFDRMVDLLTPSGWLAVMTEVLDDDVNFADWWYLRDVTHVAFYRPETLQWISDHHHLSLHRPHPNVALFQSPPIPPSRTAPPES